jgi:hypothetical protein
VAGKGKGKSKQVQRINLFISSKESVPDLYRKISFMAEVYINTPLAFLSMLWLERKYCAPSIFFGGIPPYPA